VAVCDQQRQTVHEQIVRVWRLGPWRRGSRGLTGPPQTAAWGETAGVHRCEKRFQVSLAREFDIERFQAPCGLEQQRWSIATAP
jgi:hypothetical protein